MKRIFILLLLIFFVAQNLLAQHRGDNWAISDSILLTFNQSGVSVSNSVLHNTDLDLAHFVEGMATISDESGQLLFYTNGFTVWNRNHEIMPNGDSLQCNYSITNGIEIIPAPNNDSLYYLFYIKYPLTSGTIDKGMSYSIINMNLNNGLGDIIQNEKNISLITGQILSEKTGAVRHGNGRDWWIIAHDLSDSFIEFLVTPFGIEGPFWLQSGLDQHGEYAGEVSFSPDGEKIGMVNAFSVEIFNFNRCSGAIESSLILDSVLFSASTLPWYYGCSFSSDNSKFYASTLVEYPSCDLYQFDLSNANPQLTKTLIWENTDFSVYGLGQLELGPDSNIYVVTCPAWWPDTSTYTMEVMNLSYIDEPDSLGLLCNFQPYSIPLGGHRLTLGLPNMPNYNLSALDGSTCDSLNLSIKNEKVKSKNSISIIPNPFREDFQLSVTGANSDAEISIYNIIGQEEFYSKLKPQNNFINQIISLRNYSAGVYIVSVTVNGENFIRKIIKQ